MRNTVEAESKERSRVVGKSIDCIELAGTATAIVVEWRSWSSTANLASVQVAGTSLALVEDSRTKEVDE